MFFFFFLAPSVCAVRESTQEQGDMVLLSGVIDCEDYLEYTQARTQLHFILNQHSLSKDDAFEPLFHLYFIGHFQCRSHTG